VENISRPTGALQAGDPQRESNSRRSSNLMGKGCGAMQWNPLITGNLEITLRAALALTVCTI
jgi:hypothetical protein